MFVDLVLTAINFIYNYLNELMLILIISTPTFGGAQMLMAHLQEHRERLPTGEVLYRLNCLVGPRAALNEDFDINLIAKEGVEI